MKKKINKIILFTILFMFAILKVCASTVAEQREAIIETAEAYLRQGVQLQYDSYRKNLLSTPEDATSQHYCYTVCSGFTYQVYKQTLGIDIPDTTETLLNYAKANKSNKDTVIALYEGKDYVYSTSVLGTADTPTHKKLVQDWIKIIQPGDVIVVTGHAFMVKTVNKSTNEATIMEAALGGRYNFTDHIESYDKNGTIRNHDLYTRMRTYYNYIKNGKNGIKDIAIIRFITDGKNYIAKDGTAKTYTMTSSAESRLKYKKIDIEKTLKIKSSDETFNQSVLINLDETITYTIQITNNSGSNYTNVVVEENIDSKVSVTDKGGGTLSNNKLKWTISSILPGTTVTKTYTVKVKNNQSNLNKIILSTGRVDNIATSKIETLIGNRLNKKEKNKLINAFEKNDTNKLTQKDFIRNVYKDAFGIDIYINNNISNDDILTYDSNISSGGKTSLSVKTTKIKNSNIKKLIYSNFYGMEIGEKAVAKNNIVRAILQWNIYTDVELYDRARTITKDMLYDGDIILVKTYNTSTSGEEKAFIYMYNKLYSKLDAKQYEIINETDLDTFLGNMVGQNYMILRPSIVLDEELKKLEEPEEEKKPEPNPQPDPKPQPEPTPQPDPTPKPDDSNKPVEEVIPEDEIGEDNPSEEEINSTLEESVDEQTSTETFDKVLVIIFCIIIGPIGIYVYKKNKIIN